MREEACSGGVEDLFDLSRGVGVEGTTQEVLPCGDVAVGVPLVHVCEVIFHGLGGEEGHVFYAKGGEDVGAYIVGKGLPGDSFHEYACPVNIGLDFNLSMIEVR